MQVRTHKLLILVGQEGVDLQIRDYKKLSEVIVKENLVQNNPTFKNYLSDIIVKVVRGIPLKAHFYAALTVAISREHPQLSSKIIQAILHSLQLDLNGGKFNQALNSLNYLSQAMNISFFNSLGLMNLLQDILVAVEKQTQISLKRCLLGVLIRSLPLCAHSLHEKIYHDFKKFIQKVRKLSEGDDLAEYMYTQFSQNRIFDYSCMNRLGQDYQNLTQFNSKFKLHLDLKPLREREWSQTQYYKWQHTSSNQEYDAFRRKEGAINKSIVELLIDSFSKNSNILILNIINFIRSKTDQHSLRHLVQTLLLKSLKSKRPIVQYTLLITLKFNEQTAAGKIIQQLLLALFSVAQNFQLSLMISYAKLLSFLVSNWKDEFDWQKYIINEEQFNKRTAILKLVFQKLALLNDKFICPKVLVKYQPAKGITSPEQFATTEQMESLQYFQAALKNKTQAKALIGSIDTQKNYQFFLQALFRRTALSQTHLNILQARYHDILIHFKDYDWNLINKIRNFFRNSFFHRLMYLKFLIEKGVLQFPSYINYIGQLKNKSEAEMIWIKMQLNELNFQFGKTLKFK